MAMLRLPQVKTETGHKASASIYGAIKEGQFTRPVRIGERAVAWPSHEVCAIVNARIAGKPKADIAKLVDKLHSERATAGEQVEAA